MFYQRIKRAFDVVVATSGLVAVAPIIAGTAAAIRMNMGSPVLFSQERAGLDAEPFTIYKFRTMREAFGEDGELLPDHERLSGVGARIRSWSLDELPQFLNVLQGNMSIVGPRPLPVAYVDLYSPRQALRLTVKPGITGWGAVKGRNGLDWDTQLDLDAWYVENRGLLLDLKILLLTVKTVLTRDGVSQSGTVSRERFRGPGQQMDHA